MNITKGRDLEGKLLLIYSVGQPVEFATIVKVERIEEVYGELFIIGFQPSSYSGEQNWLASAETYVAVKSIAQFHVFDNMEHFEKASKPVSSGFLNIFKR